MAEKTAEARRIRRRNTVFLSVITVVVVAAAGFGVYKLAGYLSTTGETASEKTHDDDAHEATDGAPRDKVAIDSITLSEPASADAGAAACAYPASAGSPNATDVGTPGDGDKSATGTQTMTISLASGGKVVAEIDNEKAPCTAASFTYLASIDFFNDTECHRLTTEGIFVLQCGDPSATGSGGPTYQFANEFTPKDTAEDLSEDELASGTSPEPNYPAGSIAMANAGVDTNGSQFFIVWEDTYLPADYTLFGQVTEGLDVVQAIADKGAVDSH